MSYLSSLNQLTKEFLTQLLGKQVSEINVTPVSEGHTQCIKVKVNVNYIENNKTKELKLFLKSFTTKAEFNRENTKQREFCNNLEEDLTILHNWAHNYEMNFFKFIVNSSLPSELLDILPKCFTIKENVISLENLCESRNAKILSMWNPGLNSKEMINLLNVYAKFHGFSMKLDLSKELVSYQEISENRDIRILYSAKKMGFDINERLSDIFQKLDLSELSKENLKKIKEFGFVGLSNMFSEYKGLLHGDANPNNILVDENWEKIFLVDFQEGCIGNPMADIGWLFITSCEIDNEEEVLEIYFTLLSECFGKLLDFNILMNDYYIGIMIAAYLILMVVGVVDSQYKDNFFWKLVNSCVLKLNKYDSKISLKLKSKI